MVRCRRGLFEMLGSRTSDEPGDRVWWDCLLDLNLKRLRVVAQPDGQDATGAGAHNQRNQFGQ